MNLYMGIAFAVISSGLIAWIVYRLRSEAWFLLETDTGPKMYRRYNGKWETREPTEEEAREYAKSRFWLSPTFG